MMKPASLQRRREAGLMLVVACEQALGISGPTGMARLTGRSKSWWSKLASGAAPFPTWEELERLIPASLTAEGRESLHLQFRRAWLLLNDLELLEWFDTPQPPRVSLADLINLRGTAHFLGYGSGEARTALRLLKIVEALLVSRGIEALSRKELDVLWSCMDQQSVHEREIVSYDAAVAVARRSVEYQRAAGNRIGELLARHTLGRVQQASGFLEKALREFEDLRREFQRLGMGAEVIDAQRDIGITNVAMRRPEAGEAELLRAYEAPNQSADSQFRTALWLAEASLGRGDMEPARRWLARMRVIERQHPQEIAVPMALRYIANHRADLERRAAAPQPPRKR